MFAIPPAKDSTAAKTVGELADEVIAGLWCNGQERKDRLTAAGYNYDEVQAEVNAKIYGRSGVSSNNETAATLAVGDTVKLSPNTPTYGTTKKFASWVYDATLYVREINGDRIVISTQKTGDITGAVDRRYLTKI